MLLFAAPTGCNDAVECDHQNIHATPVDGCSALPCESKACTVTFSECEGGVELGYRCEGDTCTCFGGDGEGNSCSFTQERCPSSLDVDLTGEGTEAMRQYENCCGTTIER